MNKTVGLQLVIYSLLLAGLSYFAYCSDPARTRPTLVAGLAGGGFCLVWGVWALAGNRRKALPLLTLIPVSYVLLTQTFAGWSGESVPAAAAITLLLLLSIAMLVRIAWSGVVFDVVPTSPSK